MSDKRLYDRSPLLFLFALISRKLFYSNVFPVLIVFLDCNNILICHVENTFHATSKFLIFLNTFIAETRLLICIKTVIFHEKTKVFF